MFILVNLFMLDPDNGNVNPTQRLAQIRGKVADAERQVRTLEAALTQLIIDPAHPLDEDGNLGGIQLTGVSDKGLNPNDANSIRQALYAARAYEGELRTAEQFWNQIVEANKTAEKDTHDLFKRG